MNESVVVRRALASDRATAIRTLSRAFWQDPFIAWFYPDEQLREHRIEGFFDLLWRANWRDGQIDVAADGQGAALWRPPGRWRVPRHTMLVNLPAMIGTYGMAAGRVLASLAAMEREHLAQPHWYLMTVGTDPRAQGRGLGKTLIRAGLERCDADGVPAYLESGDVGNISFYERLGFRLLSENGVRGGPYFYPMIRDPA
nr:GNAT family N-acetyltransferase [uncultured Sphingorhabdus sp.]